MKLFEEIIIELSYNCNLSCNMCGFGKHVNPYRKDKFLPFEKYKTIIEQIGNITKTVRLNGRGESTIHPDFIDILFYTKEKIKQLNINLFTNFSFNNLSILDSMIANDVQLFVSMDSPDNKELSEIRKGAKYKLIENNINLFGKSIKRPFIIFTIQEKNIHRIYDIAAFALRHKCHILFNTVRRDFGIESFIDIINTEIDAILMQFEKVNQIYKNTDLFCLYPDQIAGIKLPKILTTTQTHGTMDSCPALEKELCILYDGTVTPCNMFNPYIYGNIFTNSLEEIWQGEDRKEFLNSYKNHYYCKNCANLGV